MPDFHGLKVAYEIPDGLTGLRGVKVVTNLREPRFLFDDPGTIGAGGNSGFQALNLALQWGAKRIILIGFDMSDQSGVHWYGRNNWMNANNPDRQCFLRWIDAFNKVAPGLQMKGIEVVNASPHSELKCFKPRSIAEALADWA